MLLNTPKNGGVTVEINREISGADNFSIIKVIDTGYRN